MKMKLFSTLSLCLVVLYFETGSATGSHEWDYFVFTQQWPETVCKEAQVTHQHTCSIAQNVSTWTIHGLWPTKTGTEGPNYCNSSSKFQPSKIEPLFGDLVKYWPNIYTDEDLYSFWSHEWTKHGTCASGIPDLQGEYNFFSSVLKLNRNMDYLSMFEKEGFAPKEDYTYQFSTVLSTIQKAIGSNSVKLQCFYEKESKTQYLEQIEICLDKSFNVMECPGSENASGCRSYEPIAYPPVKHPYVDNDVLYFSPRDRT